jgi:hypothetical protein
LLSCCCEGPLNSTTPDLLQGKHLGSENYLKLLFFYLFSFLSQLFYFPNALTTVLI